MVFPVWVKNGFGGSLETFKVSTLVLPGEGFLKGGPFPFLKTFFSPTTFVFWGFSPLGFLSVSLPRKVLCGPHSLFGFSPGVVLADSPIFFGGNFWVDSF